jgi:BirA family transcriptional regulator, biotin operon repressor / biotin---[acetyl-CoA-carboxylase] ligase
MSAPSPAFIHQLGLARLDYHVRVTSTMDVAHDLAEQGAPAGTLVLAAAQETGRGRSGKSWVSEPNAGLWCTLVERPRDTRALDVLALRVGLALAEVLTPLVDGEVQLKWPNDVLVAYRKLAGVLIEVRWRDGRPEWVAIGVGVNRRVPPAFPDVACVRADVSRDALLLAVVPALRRAAAGVGPLSERECQDWSARDSARGRRVTAPAIGIVRGITADGGVQVVDPQGSVRVMHSGSLIFAQDA